MSRTDTLLRATPKPAHPSVSAAGGYRKNEDYYTPKFLCQSIDKILVMGGSYLLNVGPMPSGKVDEKSRSIIQKVGRWYNRVRESFENVECAPELFEDPSYLVTKRDQTVYLHFNRDAMACGVSLKPYNRMPLSATVLNNGRGWNLTLPLCQRIPIRQPSP